MHSTGQATWLPPSFPRSRVCVSFSFSPRRFFIFFQLPLKEKKENEKGPRKKWKQGKKMAEEKNESKEKKKHDKKKAQGKKKKKKN